VEGIESSRLLSSLFSFDARLSLIQTPIPSKKKKERERERRASVGDFLL